MLVRPFILIALFALPACSTTQVSLESQYKAVVDLAADAAALSRANSLYSDGKDALNRNDIEGVKLVNARLEELREQLILEYQLLIVSRPGEYTGVWRVPDVDPSTRNYYVIVEAIARGGEKLTLPILNEEDGNVYQVNKWGLRIEEELFRKLEADKKNDGIIDNRLFGVKRRGELDPEYFLPTTGGAITYW